VAHRSARTTGATFPHDALEVVMKNSIDPPKPPARGLPGSKIGSDHVQSLLIQAYTKLLFVAELDGGTRFATLAQFGGYEVRLFEVYPDETGLSVPGLWLELYSHHTASTIDGCGRRELDEAGTAACDLIADAWERHNRNGRQPQYCAGPIACSSRWQGQMQRGLRR
jgi:hypothetical protein